MVVMSDSLIRHCHVDVGYRENEQEAVDTTRIYISISRYLDRYLDY